MTFFLLAVLMAMAGLVSCEKTVNTPAAKADAFLYDGIRYPTLQNAVDAASAKGAWSPLIELLDDTADDGAVLPDDGSYSFFLKLGSHTYTLKEGASIDVGNNVLRIYGEGGAIISNGDEASFLGDAEGLICFFDDISLSGNNILNTSAEINITSGCTGKFKGNITLKGTSLKVFSPKCSFEVPVLTENGDGSIFSVEVDIPGSSTDINIGSVNSEMNYPVSALCDDDVTVSGGASLHVHQFEKSTVPGSCIHSDRHLLVCKSCGYTTVDPDAETTYSGCCPADLVRHEAKEPTDTEYGNIEYYECPSCGALYSDAEGSKVLDADPIRFPLGMAPMLALCGEANTLVANGSLMDDIVDFIFKLAKTGASTYSSFAGNKFSEYMAAEQKIGTISGKLAVISDQLNLLIQDAQNIPYKERIKRRQTNQTALEASLKMAMGALKIIHEKKYPATADSLRKVVCSWAKDQDGIIADMTLGMMQQFGVGAIGPNFPEMYGEVVSARCFWENEGYNLRKCLLLRDATLIALSHVLSQLYDVNDRNYSSSYTRNKHVELETSAYDDYLAVLTNEFKRMHERDSLYRRCMRKNVTFRRDIVTFDFFGYFDKDKENKFYPADNIRMRAENNCNGILTYNSGLKSQYLKAMDFETLKAIRAYYHNEKTKPAQYDIYTFLKDSVGFRGISIEKMKSEKMWLVLDEQREFKVRDNSGPCYRIFEWLSTATYGDDTFSFYPCLGWGKSEPHDKKDMSVERCMLLRGNCRNKDGYWEDIEREVRDEAFFSIQAVE